MNHLPEITLITTEYANSDISELEIIRNEINGDKHPLVKEPFFLVWLPFINEESKLNQEILKYFPQIPVKKAMSCRVNLVSFHKNGKNNKDFISTKRGSLNYKRTLGKIIPIHLSKIILLNIPVLKSKDYLHLFNHNISHSAYFWSLALKLNMQLLSEGNFIPVITYLKRDVDENFTEYIGEMSVVWEPILRSQADFTNFKAILKYAPLSAHAIIHIDSQIITSSDILTIFLQKMTGILIRESAKKSNFKGFKQVYGFAPQDASKLKDKLSWDIHLISALIMDKNKFKIYNIVEELIPQIFSSWIGAFENPCWLHNFNLGYKLMIPDARKEEWNLNFYLESIIDSEIMDLDKFWGFFNNGNIASSDISIQFKKDIIGFRRSILISLNRSAKIFYPIQKSLRDKYPFRCVLTTKEAGNFLNSYASKFKADGIKITVPEEFSIKGKQRINPIMNIYSEEIIFDKSNIENKSISLNKLNKQNFDMNEILEFEWKLKIDEDLISWEDFKQISESSDDKTLFYWKNRWIFLETEEIKRIRDNFEANLSGSITTSQALHLGLTKSLNTDILSENNEFIGLSGNFEIYLNGSIKTLVDILTGKIKIKDLSQPKSLNGKLRKYQLDGFNWIAKMTQLGFNVCLADDMGLGKTIQIISFILNNVENGKSNNKAVSHNFTSLIICPTSVLGNWIRELQKFAPTLKFNTYYGFSRPQSLRELNNFIRKNDVIISTYGLLRRDIELLTSIKWKILVLDESQNIKNYKTQQANAAYNMEAKVKICLTGTPIENRLIELWSMFHFLNPFLLGKRTDFLRKFLIPVERLGDVQAAEKLKNFISPFLLRRLKNDRKIIKDLPKKQENKLFIPLKDEQKILYSKIVDDSLKKLEIIENNGSNSTKKRTASILTTILKLKQVCNHPYQVLGINIKDIQNEPVQKVISKSGKMERLVEMLEEILSSEEKILIFSQYTALLSLIEQILIRKYQFTPLYLHGGVSQHRREEMINNFQNDRSYTYPVFLLSLKAGGTGLNLTSASIVLHFDRWWNPAVENQATDRIYRIGQKKNIMVYKMISSGTIEEKIDKLIEQKKELADMVISEKGENWITDLSFNEIKDLFKLEEQF